MGKERKAVRLFFSTFYAEDAEKLIIELRRIFGGDRVHVSRSRVVPELYFVEIASEDPLADLKRVEDIVPRVSDTIYGVKAYTVPPAGGGSDG